ncbi:hypothetical protein [Candidatus Amarolinea dominans]|uniref:hypothetical protein n=1 Tax=Candidatus Amarolinea dominans TaxID=3140696 RepID=UPI00313522EE|nr:hypothetical protein [Anaerolineae bacterium]
MLKIIALLQQLQEDTRARYQALAAVVTERAANDSDAHARARLALCVDEMHLDLRHPGPGRGGDRG